LRCAAQSATAETGGVVPDRDDPEGATTHDDVVHAVQRFALTWTQASSLLHDGLLDVDFSPTEARVMFELGQRDTVEIASLRARLHLNSGYLSRILARFEADGLLTRSRSRTDARRQVLRLTEAGVRSYRTLEERSAGEVAKLLAGVEPSAHARLVDALRTVEDLLAGPAATWTVRLRAPRPGELSWLAHRYAATAGSEEEAEARGARALCDYWASTDGRRTAWVADAGRSPVGGLVCLSAGEAGTAQVPLVFVEPAARRRGIGTRLLDEAVRHSAAAGYERITLPSYAGTAAAERLARRCGFRRTPDQVSDVTVGRTAGDRWLRDLHKDAGSVPPTGATTPQPVHENL
jgi:DNA-binding MarR family transcriptional regulator/GNAT superfamily N-acetyltransferase